MPDPEIIIINITVLQKADLKMIAAETGISGSGLAMCPYDPDDNATYIYIGKNYHIP